ncbi:MAG: hypothetical protein RBG13Loki_0204 [Promethearchaeota archaeon CR_4]|nr:MAG: hypothetical protein RBG13Loki_0204 [Candidatus Lokiarchaeota archaeon CR_4]
MSPKKATAKKTATPAKKIEKKAAGPSKVAAAKTTKFYAGSIETETLNNNFFRKILFTGKQAQLVVMSLKGGEEIGNEIHDTLDQFFRIEKAKRYSCSKN